MTAESVELVVERFLEHKRALGRKYLSEEHELRLPVRFATEQGITRLDQLTPAVLDDFLGSRPRSRPRSFNHLLGVVGCLMEWAVSQQLLTVSPLKAHRRRATANKIPFLFDQAQARRLLEAAGELRDNPRAPQRGATHRTIFALCYGLGLRVGEACGLRIGDVDTTRDLLVVRGGKFGKSRLVPHGPRIAALLAEQLQRRAEDGATGEFSDVSAGDTGSRPFPRRRRRRGRYRMLAPRASPAKETPGRWLPQPHEFSLAGFHSGEDGPFRPKRAPRQKRSHDAGG